MRRARGFAIPLPLILYGVAALAIVAALWAVYHGIEKRGYERGMAECREAAAAQREQELKAGAAASARLEESNAKAKTVYRTITREVDRIVDRPIYRDRDCVDDDGLRAINAALRGPRADPGKPDAAVPGSGAARDRDRGGDTAEGDRDR